MTSVRRFFDSAHGDSYLLYASLVCIGLLLASSTARDATANMATGISPALSATAMAQDDPAEPKTARAGKVVSVKLPITGTSAATIEQTLTELAAQAPLTARGNKRPVVILEFDTANGRTGSGSDLGACMSLARFLVSSKINRLQTVAYIPAERESKLQGHAVLVAISANTLAMDEQASIGNAGIDEPEIAGYVKDIYRELAAERFVLPVPMAEAMLNPDLELYRVVADGKIDYVGTETLKELESSGIELDTRTLSSVGKTAFFSSAELLEFRVLEFRVKSRNDLAFRFGIEPSSMEVDSARGDEPWKAVHTTMMETIDSTNVNWLKRSLNTEVKSGNANLLIIELGNSEGDPVACTRLAEYLAELDSKKTRTVAWVTGDVKGHANLIALACDQTIFGPEGSIGMPAGVLDGEAIEIPDDKTLKRYRRIAQSIAKSKDCDWSVLLAMIDPTLSIAQYRNRDSGQIRLLCNDEFATLADGRDWLKENVRVEIKSGVDVKLAERFNLTRASVKKNLAELSTYYNLEDAPRSLKPSRTDQWIEDLAMFLASPFISSLLIFGAVFFLMNEASAPGTGLFAFLGLLCLLAFFWSHYLDGTVHGFEILLLLGGIVFILLEIFVLPGFGIFGIGGLLMVVASIVLASQSFIIPLTGEEIAQAPWSLLPVFGAAAGFIAAIYTLRKVLPNTPYLRRMLLEPRRREETGLETDRDPEAIVDWSYLAGRKGVAVTRLVPSGKAKIDGRVYDVMSDGKVVDKDDPIEVIEATGNRVIVCRVENKTGDE